MMKIYNTSRTVTIHQNIPIAINSIGSYRIRVSHVFFDAIGDIRRGLLFKERDDGKYEIVINNDDRIKAVKIYNKSTCNYEISLPKKKIKELKQVDNYLKSLNNNNDRKIIEIHFRLRIDVKENTRDLTCNFTKESLKLLNGGDD